MINLNDGHRGGSFCLNKAGIAMGDGAKTGISLASVVGAGTDFCIDGILYNKADSVTNVPFTAAAAQGLLTKCLYLLCIDSGGTITTVKGTSVLTAALVDGTDVLQWPVRTKNTSVIGAVKITTASAANFTAGTTALDASNVTATFYDLFRTPVVPLTS